MSSTTQPARRDYRRVLQAFTDKPWAILPSKLALISEIIVLHMEGRHFSEGELQERIAAEQYHEAYLAARNGGRKTQAPQVAVIPIYGVITPRATLFSKISGGTGMDEFMQALNQAASDTNVSSILLDIDSPGGQVDLVPEAAAAIRAARTKKSVVAVANTMAASAAYWLASQASELVVSPSGEVGSVGVFAGHQDISQAMSEAGIKQTLIHAGKYKVELASSSPLSEEARSYVQQSVDDYYGMFTRDIASGRNTSPADARGPAFGEGRMVMARRAVSQGMADKIDTFENTLARLLRGGGVKQGAAAEDDGESIWITNFGGQVPEASAHFPGGLGLLAEDDPIFELLREDGDGPDAEAELPDADAEGVGNGGAEEGQAAVVKPQEPLAGLRQNSRTARISERQEYLSLLRRINR